MNLLYTMSRTFYACPDCSIVPGRMLFKGLVR